MIQTKKREFIPDESHKQNLPPYQHKVCASIWNISHIVSTLQHCGLQTNDQYRTHSILFLFCWIFSEINISVRRSRISAKNSLPCFRRNKKSTGRISIGLGFSGLFDFFSVSTINFLFCELVIFCAVPPQVCGCGFRPDRGLISDVRRASAEVYGEK